MTLRAQALRLTADLPWEYLALFLVLGPSTDQPGDRWGEMFIPQELARGLRAVSVPHAGGARPLVKSQHVIFQARRDPPLDHPPERGVTMLLIGLSLGVSFAGLGLAAATRPFLRVLFGALVALWGLAVGFVGCFLVFVWGFTDHVVAVRNENVLQCAPWGVALAVLGIGVIRGRPGAARLAFVLVVAAEALALAGAILKLHPAFRQENGPIIALLLPAWVGLALGLLALRRPPPLQER